MLILSPAGDLDSFKAAVNNGADEIYLGLSRFSARGNAKNFTIDELKTAREYLKTINRNVKIYAAMNTIVFDNEFEKLHKIVKQATPFLDGFIVQDFGAAEVLREYGLPLHASTQMTITSIFGLAAAKKAGFLRVVLARELSVRSIVEICGYANEVEIETEVFVQGARCASLSGQCFLSMCFGGDKIRSANRGYCAQPCRLPFSPTLSMPEMNLLRQFDKLKNVTSLKIEGRMKSADYVATATKVAVAARDNKLTDGLIQEYKNSFIRSSIKSRG